MAKRPGKETIKKTTIADMKKLGVYKPEYNRLIDIYAELVEQYGLLNQRFKDSNYDFEVETMQGGTKKAPIVATLEALRKDILAYSDRLCLNPKVLNAPDDKPPDKKSKLAEALKGLK